MELMLGGEGGGNNFFEKRFMMSRVYVYTTWEVSSRKLKFHEDEIKVLKQGEFAKVLFVSVGK